MRQRLEQLLSAGLRESRDHLFGIECLRGLAVLLVFLFHANGIGGLVSSEDPGPFRAFVLVGNTGVTLFFVLSGFLLSKPWLETLARPSQKAPRLRAYVAARALRILPLYYAAILVAALDLKDAGLILPAASFQMLGFDYFPHSVVWWTLVTEVQFYLLLPVLGWLLLGSRRRLVLLGLAALWLVAYVDAVVLADEELAGFFLTKSIFARLPAFLLGIGSAWVFLTRTSIAPATRHLLFFGGLVSLAFVLQAVAAMGESTAEAILHEYHIVEAMAWAAIVVAVAGSPPLPWFSPLVNAPMALTGKLSYSIYLNHVPILFYLVYPDIATDAALPQRLESIALAAIASVSLAAVTYLTVERPALKLKAGLGR